MGTRMRILCLPGWRTSASFMSHQIQLCGMERKFGEKVEFVTVDPTFRSTPAQDASVLKIIPEGPFYEWMNAVKDDDGRIRYLGLRETMERVNRLVDEQQFDGIMGFSQGAAIAHLVAVARADANAYDKMFKHFDDLDADDQGERSTAGATGSDGGSPGSEGGQGPREGAGEMGGKGGHFKHKLKFVICVSGLAPRDPYARQIFQEVGPLSIPSLHMVGKEDYLYETGLDVANNYFQASTIVQHPRGHQFPVFDDHTTHTVASFLDRHGQ